MREGWAYRKLGEVCESDLGKTLNSSKDTGEMRPYLCAINILWDKIDFTTLKQTRFEESELERYTVRKGDLLICEGGDIGRAAIWDKDYSIQYQNALHRVRFTDSVAPRFCLYFFMYLKNSGILDGRYGKGITIKHLVKSSLMSIPIPVAPIDNQLSIVTELDKINELIGLKKSQLSDLDRLAQSIFYDMFGDPVKGIKFERSTIGNVITNIKYGTGSPPQFSDSGFCFIRATNIKNGHIDSKDMMYIDANEASRIEKCRLSSNDLIIVRSGVNAGDTSNIPAEYVGHYAGYDIIITVNKELVNTTYINGVLNNKDYVRMIIKPLTRRAAQPHLNSQQVQGMSIPLPPLPLQQSFAARITAIEQQKQRISVSIKDLETLLASRMQYWFD